jgi:hypothetical protein
MSLLCWANGAVLNHMEIWKLYAFQLFFSWQTAYQFYIAPWQGVELIFLCGHNVKNFHSVQTSSLESEPHV